MDQQNNRPHRAKPLDVTAKRKRAPAVREETVEERLIAKANAADVKDWTGHPNLGEMSIEEFRAYLTVDR